MANTIQIKRASAGGTATPTSLQNGELAYSHESGKLFIGQPGGSTSNILTIGGKLYTDVVVPVSGSTLTLQPTGNLIITHGGTINLAGQANNITILDNSATSFEIKEASTSYLKISTANSAERITLTPATTITGALTLGTSVSVGGDGATVTGIKDEDNMASNSNVKLATQQSIKAYVDAQDLDVAGDSGSAVAIILGSETFTIAGGTGIATVGGGNTITASLSNVGTAGTYGSASLIPQITTNAQGQITGVSNIAIATTLTVDGDSGAQDASLLTDDLQILGTANEITTAVTKVSTDVKVTISLPDDVTIGSDLTVTDNLTVNGNTVLGNATSDTVSTGGNLAVGGDLTVAGTTTTVNSTVVTIDDPIFTIGGDTAPGSDDNKDRGIEFRWHNGSAAKVGYFGYDDSASYFTFIPDATNTSEVFSGTPGAAHFGSLTLATDLAVAHGGTGLSAVAKGSILVANTADTLTALDGVTSADSGTSVTGILGYKSSTDTIVWTTTIDGGTF